jgi:hypothetical protein
MNRKFPKIHNGMYTNLHEIFQEFEHYIQNLDQAGTLDRDKRTDA